MLVKLKINPETLEVTFDEPDVTIIQIKKEDGLIQVELTKPDNELANPYSSYIASP